MHGNTNVKDMEITLISFRCFNVYTNPVVNESSYKIHIIKFHITLCHLFSLTKMSKSFCAVDTHRYAIYIYIYIYIYIHIYIYIYVKIVLPGLIVAVLPLQDSYNQLLTTAITVTFNFNRTSLTCAHTIIESCFCKFLLCCICLRANVQAATTELWCDNVYQTQQTQERDRYRSSLTSIMNFLYVTFLIFGLYKDVVTVTNYIIEW